MTKLRQAGSWRYLVRALVPGDAFPHEMKRLDHCEVLGSATVDTGQPLSKREPWLVMYSRVCPGTVSMWHRRGWTVAPMRMTLPAGDSERGPVVWQARLGDGWYRVDFSTVQRPAS